MAALWEVFDGAVRILVGAGPVKQRLIDAWRDHLAPLHEKDLPEALRSSLTAVRTAMHAAHATGGMTAPEASVRKMSDKDAAEHAVRILEMYAQLCAMAELDAVPRLRVVGGEDHGAAEELPAFLSRA
ncbi:MAG TPA: hypothetical protein VFP48_00395 [Steroidobacteraceae bacterium]|nr:hypothetical protein [Steroidobacteraceae bacterium]